MDVMPSGDESDAEPLSKDMLEDIRDGSQSHPRLLIPFLEFFSSEPKRNRNYRSYRNYGNWQEFLFLWQEFPSKGNVKFGFKGTGNVGKPQ